MKTKKQIITKLENMSTFVDGSLFTIYCDELADYILAKEDEKECICDEGTISASCPVHGVNGKKSRFINTPTPSPIEEMIYYQVPDPDCSRALEFLTDKINELVKAVNNLSNK